MVGTIRFHRLGPDLGKTLVLTGLDSPRSCLLKNSILHCGDREVYMDGLLWP
jgi:hypothetical protein